MKKPIEIDKNKTVYEVAWPRGPSAVNIIPLAKRLDTLQGKTIGEIWNGVFRGDELFPALEEELKKRYPDVKFINFKEFGNAFTAHEAKVFGELPAIAKKYGCDGFIVGVGA